jgi:protein tyrosine phosphatase (PTP) superfamily phosphohydrolase (DUF442 family)
MRDWVFTFAACVFASGCSPAPPTREGAAPVDDWSPRPVASLHLPNAYRLHEKVICGGQPDGEAAFRELSALGVRTIISVDGAPPQVERARKYGLRYVHLPHGYDGIPEEKAWALAKAVRDLPGPIYIHCHHGKHRSPTAAAVACVGAGLLRSDQAVAVLRTAGTSSGYRGLYQSAERARRIDETRLEQLEVNFPEAVDMPPMAEAMVAIDQTFERLKRLERTGWVAPGDFDAPHEALLLREHFTELLRSQAVADQSEPFLELLRVSETAAAELETALREWTNREQSAPNSVLTWLTTISEACQSCHRQFRDVPLEDRGRTPSSSHARQVVPPERGASAP